MYLIKKNHGVIQFTDNFHLQPDRQSILRQKHMSLIIIQKQWQKVCIYKEHSNRMEKQYWKEIILYRDNIIKVVKRKSNFQIKLKEVLTWNNQFNVYVKAPALFCLIPARQINIKTLCELALGNYKENLFCGLSEYITITLNQSPRMFLIHWRN